MATKFRFALLFLLVLYFTSSALAQTVTDQGSRGETEGDAAPAPAPAPAPSGGDDSGVQPEDPQLSPNPPPPEGGGPFRPHKPRFNRFNRWMKVLNEFFSQGNWMNGGPDNLLEYIGATLTRLMDIMFNRDGGGESISTSELFGTVEPEGRGFPSQGSPKASRARTISGAGGFQQQDQRPQLTVEDILRMIPRDRLNNNNNHAGRLFE